MPRLREEKSGKPRTHLPERRDFASITSMPNSYPSVLRLLEESRQELRDVPRPVKAEETLDWLREHL